MAGSQQTKLCVLTHFNVQTKLIQSEIKVLKVIYLQIQSKLFLVSKHKQKRKKMRKFFKQKVLRKKPSHQQKHDIVMMQSNTLGMTVIQQDIPSSKVMEPLTAQEWVDIISTESLDGYPYSRIYFSFLKGLPQYLRMKIWVFLVKGMCNLQFKPNPNEQEEKEERVDQFEKAEKSDKPEQDNNRSQFRTSYRQSNKHLTSLSSKTYVQLSTKQPAFKEYDQIQKDIHRSFAGREKYAYTQQILRRCLYAVSNWGIQYSQGMNYILLNVIIYCLQSLDLDSSSYGKLTAELERDIFVIMVGIVSQLEETFGNNNIFKVMSDLEEKIAESEPEILFLIYQLGMDCFSCFSQYYYSLMSYNDPPEELCKYMMDLFFLEGEKAITSMTVRMLEICHGEILKIKDPQVLQNFMKNDIFHFCYKVFKENQHTAKKLEDFGMSFYNNVQKF